MFNESDVIRLARDVFSRGVEYTENYGNAAPGYKCGSCYARQTKREASFQHEKSCIVLVAQDVLTGVLYE